MQRQCSVWGYTGMGPGGWDRKEAVSPAVFGVLGRNPHFGQGSAVVCPLWPGLNLPVELTDSLARRDKHVVAPMAQGSQWGTGWGHPSPAEAGQSSWGQNPLGLNPGSSLWPRARDMTSLTCFLVCYETILMLPPSWH